MMSEYLEPEKDQDSNKSEKRNDPSGKTDSKLEKKGPQKDKNFKVLNKDGSLPDNPYNNEPGGGASEGTVGLGT